MATKKTIQNQPTVKELKSDLMKSGLVSFNHYTSSPSTVITIKGALSDEAKEELKNAIDEILSIHAL